MKKTMLPGILVLSIILFFSLVFINVPGGACGKDSNIGEFQGCFPQPDTTIRQDVKVAYTCPMHPEVIKEQAGKCPKCKMDLKKKDADTATYTCPMHPEVVKKAAGKCPKCGMNLEKKTAKKDDQKK